MQNAEWRMQTRQAVNSAFCPLHSAFREADARAVGGTGRCDDGDGAAGREGFGRRQHECRMQNGECRRGRQSILHSALCILHSAKRMRARSEGPAGATTAMVPPGGRALGGVSMNAECRIENADEAGSQFCILPSAFCILHSAKRKV